jgi:HD-like signal output (HDOD) protein
MNGAEADAMKETVSQQYNVSVVSSPKELIDHLQNSAVMIVDHSFTEHHGTDLPMRIIQKGYLPVVMLILPDDVGGAIEARSLGASNYIVKVGDYHQILNLSIKAEVEKFSQQQQSKETLAALTKRVGELEGQLTVEDQGELERQTTVDDQQDAQKSPVEKEENILDEISFVFKRKEISLPSHPQISGKFREMVTRGANLQEIGSVLKQDAAISSKLISVSNSAYYRGVTENKTLEQAVGRLGFATTNQYVDAICSRALYITKNKNFLALMEQLWEHSLSCAYASQVVCTLLKLKLGEDPFTLGLLHDIGKLLLLQTVGELQDRKKLGEQIDSADLLNTIDTNHGKFGGALLKRWEFSNSFVQVATHHDHLEEVEPVSKELLVVNFANLVAKSMGYNLGQQIEIDLEASKSARELGLNSKRIAEVSDHASSLMEEMKVYFV